MQWFSKNNFLAELGLHYIGVRISKNYALEINFLHFIRNSLDGIIYLKFDINSDFYKGDHNPQFHIELVFLNLLIFEFRIYNINHIEHENTTNLNIPCPNCGKTVNIRLEE